MCGDERVDSISLTPQSADMVEPAFSVMCNQTLNSVDSVVSVACSSSGGDIATLNCTFDNSSQAQDCRKCGVH